MIKDLIKNKKGIALESAILFMVVIFSLSTLICLMSLTGHNQTIYDNKNFLNHVSVEQVGEDFLLYVQGGAQTPMPQYEKFNYEIDGNSITVYDKASGNVRLYVEASLGADGRAVIETWRNIAPQNIE